MEWYWIVLTIIAVANLGFLLHNFTKWEVKENMKRCPECKRIQQDGVLTCDCGCDLRLVQTEEEKKIRDGSIGGTSINYMRRIVNGIVSPELGNQFRKWASVNKVPTTAVPASQRETSIITEGNEMVSKGMLSIGVVLLLVGFTLSIIQLSWKREHMADVPAGLNRDFSLRTRRVGTGYHYERLDDSYLHLGIGLMIVGGLLVVGSFVAKSYLPIGTPITKQPVPQTSAVETPKAPEPTEEPKGTDIPEQIERLAKLKEQGILTDEEFEEKKKELLARM